MLKSASNRSLRLSDSDRKVIKDNREIVLEDTIISEEVHTPKSSSKMFDGLHKRLA